MELDRKTHEYGLSKLCSPRTSRDRKIVKKDKNKHTDIKVIESPISNNKQHYTGNENV